MVHRYHCRRFVSWLDFRRFLAYCKLEWSKDLELRPGFFRIRANSRFLRFSRNSWAHDHGLLTRHSPHINTSFSRLTPCVGGKPRAAQPRFPRCTQAIVPVGTRRKSPIFHSYESGECTRILKNPPLQSQVSNPYSNCAVAQPAINSIMAQISECRAINPSIKGLAGSWKPKLFKKFGSCSPLYAGASQALFITKNRFKTKKIKYVLIKAIIKNTNL